MSERTKTNGPIEHGPMVSGRTAPQVGAARAWTTAGVAVIAGLVVWVLIVEALGVDVRAGSPAAGMTASQAPTVGPVNVLVAALAAGLLAWPVAALQRRCGRTRRVWLLTCGAVLLVSLLGAASAATTPSAGAALVAMHVVVGAVVAAAYALRWPTRER